jgi:hypothetical protein
MNRMTVWQTRGRLWHANDWRRWPDVQSWHRGHLLLTVTGHEDVLRVCTMHELLLPSLSRDQQKSYHYCTGKLVSPQGGHQDWLHLSKQPSVTQSIPFDRWGICFNWGKKRLHELEMKMWTTRTSRFELNLCHNILIISRVRFRCRYQMRARIPWYTCYLLDYSLSFLSVVSFKSPSAPRTVTSWSSDLMSPPLDNPPDPLR